MKGRREGRYRKSNMRMQDIIDFNSNLNYFFGQERYSDCNPNTSVVIKVFSDTHKKTLTHHTNTHIHTHIHILDTVTHIRTYVHPSIQTYKTHIFHGVTKMP